VRSRSVADVTTEPSTRDPLPGQDLVCAPEPGGFDVAELDGLPEPVRRYFVASIAPGTPPARSARLRMNGTIRIGRWLPFEARELLSPLRGFVWSARAAGVVTGSDRYVDGKGVADWRLAGLLPVMHAAGTDVSRSAAGRAGAEGVWLPTALLPRYGVRWTAEGCARVTACYRVGTVPVRLRLRLDEAARPASFVFDRWGDPGRTGTWGWHPFGGEVTEHRTFDGITIPSAGRIGWSVGTDRRPDGEFFRYRITDLHLVAPARGATAPNPAYRPEPLA
jgi:hypothetical protein